MVHTVHTNRDKQGRREGRGGVWETEGERGGTGRHGVCFVRPKWGKAALTHLPSHLRNKKRQVKSSKPPLPHILKNNNTGRWEQKRRKMDAVRTSGRWPLRWSSTDRRRRREVAVEVVSAVGSHLVIFISVCDWRTGKGLARREKRGGRRYTERRGGGGGRGQGGEGAGWPFFAEHRHSLCIFSSFKSTYTICSCRLVDILVYVHSSERTHAKSIIGDGEKGGRSM